MSSHVVHAYQVAQAQLSGVRLVVPVLLHHLALFNHEILQELLEISVAVGVLGDERVLEQLAGLGTGPLVLLEAEVHELSHLRRALDVVQGRARLGLDL
jgi:hypothetical protein